MTLTEAEDEFRKIQHDLAAWALASAHLKISAIMVREKGDQLSVYATGMDKDLIRMLAQTIVSLSDGTAPVQMCDEPAVVDTTDNSISQPRLTKDDHPPPITNPLRNLVSKSTEILVPVGARRRDHNPRERTRI